MSADLVAFVRARLDEEAEEAREAAEAVGDGQWRQRNARIVTAADRDREVADYAVHECIEHITRHDPALTLRRIARDRAILDEYEEVADMDTPDAEYEFAHGRAVGLGIAVRHMATAHAEHVDYKPSWTSGFTR